MKLNRIIVCGCFLLSAPLINAQTKLLSLEDAILKARKELAPENRKSLQWIKDSDAYTYILGEDSLQELIKAYPDRDKTEKIISLEDLNKRLGTAKKLRSFPRIKWLGSEQFLFHHDNKDWIWHKRSVDSLLTYPKEAANFDFEPVKRQMAFTLKHNLYYSTGSGQPVPVTSDSIAGIVNGQAVHRYEFGIFKGTFWSPKGRYLAFYRKDESMVTDYPLVSIDKLPASSDNIKYPMAGGKSHHVRLGVFDISSQRTVFLQTAGPKDQYLTNICWDPSEKFIYVAVLNRDQNLLKFQQFETATGKFVATLFEEYDNQYVEPEKPAVFLKTKADQFLWFSERDGYMHLYHYQTDGKLIRQITRGPWVVLDILGFDASETYVFVKGTGKVPTEQHLYKIEIATGTTTQLTREKGVHDGKLSASGKYLIDSYSSLETPRRIDLLNEEGKSIKNLLTAENPLKDYKIGACEISSISGDDGTALYTRLIKPHDFDPAKKYPVLVYVYGGPHLQMIRDQWGGGAPLWMHYLASQGYLVFSLDNRGSANRGLAFEQSVFRQLGAQEMDDQLEGVNYLKSLSYVDANRMAVHGWSFGGFMTTTLMLRAPEVFKVGVAGGPVIDWKFYEVMYTERYMDTPEDNPNGYRETSLLRDVKTLKGDLLLIHGTVDDVVVWQHSLAFLKQCVDEGVMVDYFVYPGHPHNVRGKDRVHLMQKVLSYILDRL